MTENRDFRAYQPRQLVPARPDVRMRGAGTVFRAGDLVDADEAGGPHPDPWRPRVLQLAARRR